MTENWLQRTVNAPEVMSGLIKRFGKERIDEIEQADAYKDAQAIMALALNQALNKTKLSRGKRRAVGTAMLSDVMTGCISAFLLGYQMGQQDRTEEIAEMPDGSMGLFPKEYGRAQ